jgi:hypothetical protein
MSFSGMVRLNSASTLQPSARIVRCSRFRWHAADVGAINESCWPPSTNRVRRRSRAANDEAVRNYLRSPLTPRIELRRRATTTRSRSSRRRATGRKPLICCRTSAKYPGQPVRRRRNERLADSTRSPNRGIRRRASTGAAELTATQRCDARRCTGRPNYTWRPTTSTARWKRSANTHDRINSRPTRAGSDAAHGSALPADR